MNNIRDKPKKTFDIIQMLGLQFKEIDTHGFLVYKRGRVTMFNEKNKGGIEWNFKADNDDLFLSTKDFYKVTDDKDRNQTFRVHGYFFFDTQYGTGGAFIMKQCNLYIPKHLIDTIKDFSDDEIQAIKNGGLGITLHIYKSHGKKCVGVNLCDIDNDVVYDEYEFNTELATQLKEDDV